jgi:riboflavin synthase
MFTGIITERGTVISMVPTPDGGSAVLLFEAPESAHGLEPGGSIAVNGVCLTATTIEGSQIRVDVIGETLERTTTGALASGSRVNLERCVQPTGRLDGHVVQGHVDGVGTLLERENLGPWHRLRFSVPPALARYAAEKGSVAVDGVSLTVTAVSAPADPVPWFEVGLIPTTLAETGLGSKDLQDRVNLEMDVLAKYAERLLAFTPREPDIKPEPTAAAAAEGAQ